MSTRCKQKRNTISRQTTRGSSSQENIQNTRYLQKNEGREARREALSLINVPSSLGISSVCISVCVCLVLGRTKTPGCLCVCVCSALSVGKERMRA